MNKRKMTVLKEEEQSRPIGLTGKMGGDRLACFGINIMSFFSLYLYRYVL